MSLRVAGAVGGRRTAALLESAHVGDAVRTSGVASAVRVGGAAALADSRRVPADLFAERAIGILRAIGRSAAGAAEIAGARPGVRVGAIAIRDAFDAEPAARVANRGGRGRACDDGLADAVRVRAAATLVIRCALGGAGGGAVSVGLAPAFLGRLDAPGPGLLPGALRVVIAMTPAVGKADGVRPADATAVCIRQAVDAAPGGVAFEVLVVAIGAVLLDASCSRAASTCHPAQASTSASASCPSDAAWSARGTTAVPTCPCAAGVADTNTAPRTFDQGERKQNGNIS